MSPYRGSQKHKNRPSETRKGTLCPEWTHSTSEERLGHDPFRHPWEKTCAHELFERAVSANDGKRRFATLRGIAFEAKPTGDGTWHGFPVPWESVPAEIVQSWIKSNAVSRRDVKRHFQEPASNIHWALDGDGP